MSNTSRMYHNVVKYTVNADKSLTSTSYYYALVDDKNMGQTKYELFDSYTKIIPPLQVMDQAQFFASRMVATTDPAEFFTGRGFGITSYEVALLHVAIDHGMQGRNYMKGEEVTLTMEYAMKTLGHVEIFESPALAFFTGTMPQSVDESLLINTSLTVKDLLSGPNAYVDASGSGVPGSVFALPAGVTQVQAIADHWGKSDVALISQIVKTNQVPTFEEVVTVDGTVSDTMTLNTTPYAEAIQKVYIAYFNRPADPKGFNYYDQLIKANGGDVAAATTSFEFSKEYLDTYAGLTSSQRIDAIYTNLFGRHAESSGLEYWVKSLDSGALTINNIARSILSGAQNDDASVISNRVKVAQKFTAELDNQTKVGIYSGLEAAATTRAWLGTVMDDAASVTKAISGMDSLIKKIGVSGSFTFASDGGHTFTLPPVIGLERESSVLVIKAGDGKNSPVTVNNFNKDKIDVSDFDFANGTIGVVTKAPIISMKMPAHNGFFQGADVIISNNVSDSKNNSYVYIDTNKNGNFDSGIDSTIEFVGSFVSTVDIIF